MLRIAKTLLLVVLLTAIIWGWAEQSQTSVLDKQTFDLEIMVPANRCAIFSESRGTWTPTLRVKVTANFEGQQGGIAQLSQRIDRGDFGNFQPVYNLPLNLREGADAQAEEVNLARAINGSALSELLNKLHVTVTSVSPATVTLQLVRVRPYDLPIVAHFSDNVERPVVVKDSFAKVLLPVGLYESLSKQKKASVRAEVNLLDGETAIDLTKPAKAVLAAQIEGFPVRPTPAETVVQFDVKMRDYTLENVPVAQVSAREFPWQDYTLDSDRNQWRKTIVVRGPVDKTITPADINAYLRFETTDKEQTAGLSRDVEIVLPQGFELRSPQKGDEARAIKFKFVKREERPPS